MSLDVGPFAMPLDADVQVALDVAWLEAAAHDHESVEVEHVALALLADPDVARALDRLGARADAIESALEEALLARRRVASQGGERAISPALSYALHLPGDHDRTGLLAALVAQSSAAPAVAAAGGSPAQLASAPRLARADASAPSPYRARTERSWTLHLGSAEELPGAFRAGIAQLLGLSRAGSARAGLGAPRPEGVDVGLFTEADAKDFAQAVEKHALAAGSSLHVEPRQCRSDAALEEARVRARRWWRTVQGLRLAALVLGVAATALVTAQGRESATMTMAQAVAAPDGDVRVRGEALPDNPRFLLSEGGLFVADPREPGAAGTPFFDDRLIDTRISIRYLPEPVFSFDADRELRTARGDRMVWARWHMVTCPNCTSDVLVVHDRRSDRPVQREFVEATVRSVGGAGRSADDLRALYRAHGGQRDIGYVLDVDPLPAGPTQKLIPICLADGVVNARCTPYLWGLADGNRGRTTGIRGNVLEGWLGTSEDPRLRLASGPPSLVRVDGHSRILQLRPLPPPAHRFLFAGASCAVAALLLAAVAQRVRRRGRPAPEV